MKKLAIILTALCPVLGCGEEPDRMQMPPPDVGGVPQQVVYGDDDICPFPRDVTFFTPEEFAATRCDASRPFGGYTINPNALTPECRVGALGYFYPGTGVDFCQWMLDIWCDDPLQGTSSVYAFTIRESNPRTADLNVYDPSGWSTGGECYTELFLVAEEQGL